MFNGKMILICCVFLLIPVVSFSRVISKRSATGSSVLQPRGKVVDVRPAPTPTPPPNFPSAYAASALSQSTWVPYLGDGSECVAPLVWGAAVNNAGFVAGHAQSCNQAPASLFDPFTNQTLQISPLNRYAEAKGMNNNGEVVGFITGGGLNPFIYHSNTGTFEQIQLGFEVPLQGAFYDINNAGVAVGIAAGMGAITWQNGQTTGLGTLPGDSQATALAINSSGAVVGYSGHYSNAPRAFVLIGSPSIYEPMTSPGATRSAATDINDNNHFVGWYADANDLEHAFISQDGAITEMGFPDNCGSRALSISNAGQVVGFSCKMIDGYPQSRAFIWDAANGTRDLSELVQAVGPNGHPISFQSAVSISQDGTKIVVTYGSSDTYLLTPIE